MTVVIKQRYKTGTTNSKLAAAKPEILMSISVSRHGFKTIPAARYTFTRTD